MAGTDPPATRCPLCGGDNGCMPATAASIDRRCWCEDFSFAPTLLDRIPAAARGRSCVCRCCVAAYAPNVAID